MGSAVAGWASMRGSAASITVRPWPSNRSARSPAVTAATLGGLWGNLWVILGLVGVAITIGMGISMLTPRAKKAEAGHATGGASPAVVAISREILTLAKFDAVLLFTVVADMVLKPEASDWVTLVIMAVVLIAAAAVWLPPAFRKPVTA